MCSKRRIPEYKLPLSEAAQELIEEIDNLLIAMNPAGSQAAGSQAVLALIECTRRLREIVAEFHPVKDDDDEAV